MNIAEIFTDHMVLQANKEINIFGSGKGKGRIEFLGAAYDFTSDDEKWCVSLPPSEYCGPVEMKIVMNGTEKIIRDIYVGEVWFAGGQSNMEMPLFRTECGFSDARNAKNSMIRFYTVPRRMEKDTVSYGWHFEKTISENKGWELCDENSALHFSAIGYYTAKRLYEELNVAVGIISCNWGGREIENFIKKEYFYDNEVLKPIAVEYDRKISELDVERYEKEFKNDLDKLREMYESIDFDEVEWTRNIGTMATSGLPGEIPSPTFGLYAYDTPGRLYNSMIEPISPFGFKGVMWYHGETNVGGKYYDKCKTLIKCIRDTFKDDNLPFFIVEIASFNDGGENEISDRFVTDEENWAFTREGQQKLADEDENAYIVTSMELGDLYDVHPPRKKELSKRIENKILKYSYGFNINADEPRFEKVEFKNGKAYVKLKNAEGLFARHLASVKIYIADETKELKRAAIEICGDTLVLLSPDVKKPCLVRYGFDRYYVGCHIYNKEGLPLAPFRTDRS